MKIEDIQNIVLWLSRQGYEGAEEVAIISGFCERCNAAGLEISRALGIIDTLHPDFEGRVFQWDSTDTEIQQTGVYVSTTEGQAKDSWERSVFYHLTVTGRDEVRWEIAKGAEFDFDRLGGLKEAGHTDYIALIHRFTESGRVGEMDAFYSYWATRQRQGFSEEDLSALRILLPTLALAIKAISSLRIITTIADVYLGKDAGARVVSGRITRGTVETIDAVLWFSDLHDYTGISDRAEAGQIIPFLNDYAQVTIDAIHDNGGSVLKLIGDGILAIFKSDDPQSACISALQAEKSLRRELAALNARRADESSPTTGVYLGLHIGEVFYGNIGSRNRLDFTVVGPAVNEVSRIMALCNSVGRHAIISDDFFDACPSSQQRHLVSLGRFALRGVGRAKELFTLDPEIL
jgi:adenylate cyclase